MMVGIDFETANKNPDSAISIGIVVLDDSFKIVDEKYFLIKPPSDEFEFTYIHGLVYDDVKDAKTFGELWDEMGHYFNNSLVYAHNAVFDMNVLSAVLKLYGLHISGMQYFCTKDLASSLFPKMEKYNLKYVSEKLNFKFTHHHALEDAKACSEIVISGFKRHGIAFKKLLKVNTFNG